MFVLGDVPVDDTLYLPVDTFDSNGASVTITGLAVTDIEIYKDGSVTTRASDNGYTLLDTDGIDFNGAVGLHGFSVDLSDNSDASFYVAGSHYWLNVDAITVDGQTVRFTYLFTIGLLLRPSTAGRTLGVDANGRTDVGAWLGTAVTTSSTTTKPEVDLFSVSDEALPANNMQLGWNGTGVSGDQLPSTQAQVGNIATGAGGLSALISAFAKVGAEPETNTFTATQQGNGVYHIVEDDVGNTDFYYEATVGAGGKATAFKWKGYVQSNGDSTTVWYWDWVSTTYKQIDTLSGSNGTTPTEEVLDVPVGATGTGADQGKVRLRFLSTTTTAIATDKLLCEFSQASQSAGYQNGQIWMDSNSSNTNTVLFVDGVVDNVAGSWANAVTLSGLGGMTDFHILNGSTVVLTGVSDNFSLFGDNWILQLANRSVAGAYFQGAHVSGVGTSATEVHFEGCDVETMSVQIGHFDFCSFNGTVTHTLAGDYNYHNCYSKVPGALGPTFAKTAGQVITVQYRGWKGSLNLTGLEVGDTLTIGGVELGTIDLGSPAGAVAIEIRGIYKEVTNIGSAAVNLDGAIKAADVALILADTNELQTDDVPGLIAALNNLSAAQVNAEVDTALNTAIPGGPTANSINERMTAVDNYVPYIPARIWIDTPGGTVGDTYGENGTRGNAVKTLAEAVTLAAASGIHEYGLLGASLVELVSAHLNWSFFGQNGATVNVGAQNTSGSHYECLTLTGDMDGNDTTQRFCKFQSLTNFIADAMFCLLIDNVTESPGDHYWFICASGVAGTGTPYIDVNGNDVNARNNHLRGFFGGAEMRTHTSTDTTSFDCPAGQIVVAASCTGGTIAMRGNIDITDNAAAAVTFAQNAAVSNTSIAQSLHGATWYVDKTGNDANTGQSFGSGRAFLTIGAAVAVVAAGDTIKIGAGTFSEAIDTTAVGAIRFMGMGKLRTIVTDSGATFQVAAGTTIEEMSAVSTASVGVGASSVADVTLRRCRITGAVDSVLALFSTRLRIEGCDLEGVYDVLNVGSSDGFYAADSTFRTTSSDVTSGNCIIAGSTNGVMDNCILDASQTTQETLDATALWCPVTSGSKTDLVLNNCSLRARITNALSTGETRAVRVSDTDTGKSVVLLNNCAIASENAGSGNDYNLLQTSGTLAVNNCQYDTAKTSGTITDVRDDIVTDTNELQTDWTDGGRLDLILDATGKTGADSDTLETLSDQIDTLSALSGEGAFTGTLTVDDGATGLEGVAVNARRGGVLKATGVTNASGQITNWVFGAFTYDLASRLDGYQSSTDTLTVSADAWTKTISLTIISITAPSAATLCTVQFRVNLSATAVSGAVCKARLNGINHASDGTILSNQESSDTTDAQGVAELELVQQGSLVKGSGVYDIWIEIDGKSVASTKTTIPSQSTVLFEDLL